VTILGRSALTARRRECLAALDAGVRAAGGAVHYSAVAEPLGISAWTAYDLLRELERDGLVATSYAHRAGVAVGRTQVGFAPTAAGRAALGEPRAPLAEERALRRAQASLAGAGSVAGALAAVQRGSRGVDLTGHLAFWLSQAERLPGRTRTGLRQVLRTAPEAATALSMFVAGVYGAVSAESAEVADALSAELGAFQRRLSRTTAARRERLARSLAALLDHHLAAPTDAAPQPGA
jgi:DNA-binding Lrp family transcriptional regulator